MAQNLTYTQCGDYFIPDIRLAHTEAQILGKYGRMRRIFLEQNKPILFNDMILNETLFLQSDLHRPQRSCIQSFAVYIIAKCASCSVRLFL